MAEIGIVEWALGLIELALVFISVAIIIIYSSKAFGMLRQKLAWKALMVACCLVGLHVTGYILWNLGTIWWSAVSLGVLISLVWAVGHFRKKGWGS